MKSGIPDGFDGILGGTVFGGRGVTDSPLWLLSDLLAIPQPLLAEASSGSDRWWRFLGRLHPLMVHFPIGLAIAAAGVEFVNILRRRTEASPFAFTATGFAAVAACLAAWFGWLNADFENARLDNTLFIHRWLGVIAAGGLVLVFLTGWLGRSGTRLRALNGYRWGLVVCAILVGVGSHFGGSMVYGSGYLTKVLFPPKTAETAPSTAPEPAAEAKPAPVEDADDGPPAATPPASEAKPAAAPPAGEAKPAATPPAGEAKPAAAPPAAEPEQESSVPAAPVVARKVSFVKDVLPILDARCVECHGPNKVKGSLRMDTAAELFAGDPEWWTVVPGKPDESLLLERVLLPAEDPDAMPPRGDRLTAAQIDTIRTWIAEGAEHGVTASAPAAEIEPAPAKADDVAASAPDAAAVAAAVSALRERDVVVMPISQADPEYEVNASLVKPAFADADLARLDGLQPLLVWLDLGRTAVTDEGLEVLREYTAITRLSLDHTNVGDAVVDVLLALPKLEMVNLFGTKLGDEGLKRLAGHPGLQRLYCAETAVSGDAVDTARSAHPALDIVGPLKSSDRPDSDDGGRS